MFCGSVVAFLFAFAPCFSCRWNILRQFLYHTSVHKFFLSALCFVVIFSSPWFSFSILFSPIASCILQLHYQPLLNVSPITSDASCYILPTRSFHFVIGIVSCILQLSLIFPSTASSLSSTSFRTILLSCFHYLFAFRVAFTQFNASLSFPTFPFLPFFLPPSRHFTLFLYFAASLSAYS